MTYCLNPDCLQPQNPDTNKICQGCGLNLYLQNRYRAIKLISQGGFGRTFLAVDEGESPVIPYAIKQLFPRGLSLPLFEKAKALFEQEVLLLSKLGKHAQIPTLLEHFTQEQQFYLVQEFIDGTNLAQMVAEAGTFTESDVWQVLGELLPVVQFICDRNIIHRDIKPQNIIQQSCHSFSTENSESRESGKLLNPPILPIKKFVLVDFGAAKIVTNIDSLNIGTSIGSPEYVAPEQARGKAVFASDIYSLGVTCLYLLTGISPFDLFDTVNHTWVWRDYLTQEVSDNLGKILDKMVQNALTNRFQSANEVMEAINKIRGMGGFARQYIGKTDNLKTKPAPLWQCQDTFTHKLAVNSVAVSPDGNILASGCDDKTIYLWDLKNKRLIARLTGHTDTINFVAFSPDGQIIASGSNDKTIKLWSAITWQELCTLKGHTHKVTSVTFSPDSQILASGSWDKTVKLWQVETREILSTLSAHTLQISAVAFSPCGNFIASASLDRTTYLWDIQFPETDKQFPTTKNEISSSPLPTPHSPLPILIGHDWAVLTVAFSPNGNILATGSDDNTIKLWDRETGASLQTIYGHSWLVASVIFSPDGETIISGSWDKTIKLWQVSTGQEIATFEGHNDSVSAVAIHPNGEIIVSGSKDKTIKVWYRDRL